jgi:ABC-type spermidine/putrescine transport system permease subunit II
MRTSWRQTFLLVAIVAVLGVGLVYPILLTVGGAFRTDDGGFTLRHIASVFEDPATRRGLLNATLIAAITTTMAILARPFLVACCSCRSCFHHSWAPSVFGTSWVARAR